MTQKRTGICYIAGAGRSDLISLQLKENDLTIAADGGFDFFQKSGIQPGILLGDFDSIENFPAVTDQVIRYPAEKDDTDMMLAIKVGLSHGYRTYVLFGGLGNRIDHSQANIQSLAYLTAKNAIGFLYSNGTYITVIRNTGLIFPKKNQGILSVFAHNQTIRGVTLSGLKYPLTNATLHNSIPLGVSNEFIGEEARISVERGTLVIIWYGEPFRLKALPKKINES